MLKKFGIFLGIMILFTSPILLLMWFAIHGEYRDSELLHIFKEILIPIFLSISLGELFVSLIDEWVGKKDKDNCYKIIIFILLSAVYIYVFVISWDPNNKIHSISYPDFIKALIIIILLSLILGIIFGYEKKSDKLKEENSQKYKILPDVLKNEFEQKNKKIEKYETLLNSIQNIINKQQNEIQEKSDH